jgi:hypothetical protein
MLEIVLGFLWTVSLGASLVACTVALVVAFLTRKLH